MLRFSLSDSLNNNYNTETKNRPLFYLILLIFRIDRFLQEIVKAQKEGYRKILENNKEIHNTITALNQQNREHYSLWFSELQKELAGVK